MKAFLRYWRPEEARSWWSDPSAPIYRSWSGQYIKRRVARGDALWFVTVVDRVLLLIGRMDVDEVIDAEEAAIRFDDARDAPYTVCELGRALRSVKIDVTSIAVDFVFNSAIPRLDMTQGISGQLQTIRELAPESHLLLERFSGLRPGLARPVLDGEEPPAPDTDERHVFPPLEETNPRLAEKVLLVPRPLRSTPSAAEPSMAGAKGRRNRLASEIGRRAEEIVRLHLEQEQQGGRIRELRWVSEAGERPGWDIEFTSSAGTRTRVEVKGTVKDTFESIELTANEWAAAQQHGANYWLALVSCCDTRTPLLWFVEWPARLVDDKLALVEPVVWRLVLLGQ